MKKISVIIPCYCIRDEWLDRLFLSLQKQTLGFAEIEVIFVIDASPDDTFERLEVYENKYPENVMLIQCNEKVGPGGARTLGIQYASGEYIAFLDQDDWIEPCMYQHMYEKAVLHACDVVESYNTRDVLYEYNEGEPKKTGKADSLIVLETPEDRKAYFKVGRPEQRKYWAKIYRRTFLLEEDLTFPSDLKYDDNYFKGMVFYHAKRIYVIEEYLYHWMVNTESISMQKDDQVHLDRMRIELLKLEEYRNRGLFATYHDEMEYIFIEQFYVNTFNTICTRSGGVSVELLTYMCQEMKRQFPEYRKNPYISIRYPVWCMGEWIENALKWIEQVRGAAVDIPQAVLQKIAPLSFLDLLEADLTQEELSWYCAIYVAFDKVSAKKSNTM